jgi:hypothetical protein
MMTRTDWKYMAAKAGIDNLLAAAAQLHYAVEAFSNRALSCIVCDGGSIAHAETCPLIALRVQLNMWEE